MRLNGKNAVLAGPLSPVMRETIGLFLAEGAQVAWLEPFGDTAAAGQAGLDASVRRYAADIAIPEQTQEAAGRILADLGRADILVSDLPVRGTHCPTLTLPQDLWQKAVDYNISAQFYLCKYFLPKMLPHGGSVVFLSSIFALRGETDDLCLDATAAGMLGVMRSAAGEYGPQGIRVNALLPTLTDGQTTDAFFVAQHLNSRLPAPAEIARALLFLASDDSSYMNGAAVPLDGGLHIS